MKKHEVGYTWERKDFEYEVVASVKHDSNEEVFVLLVKSRNFVYDEVEYITMEVFVGKRYDVSIIEKDTKKEVWTLNEKPLKYHDAFQLFSKNAKHIKDGYEIHVEEVQL